jgi:hypothetical protein
MMPIQQQHGDEYYADILKQVLHSLSIDKVKSIGIEMPHTGRPFHARPPGTIQIMAKEIIDWLWAKPEKSMLDKIAIHVGNLEDKTNIVEAIKQYLAQKTETLVQNSSRKQVKFGGEVLHKEEINKKYIQEKHPLKDPNAQGQQVQLTREQVDQCIELFLNNTRVNISMVPTRDYVLPDWEPTYEPTQDQEGTSNPESIVCQLLEEIKDSIELSMADLTLRGEAPSVNFIHLQSTSTEKEATKGEPKEQVKRTKLRKLRNSSKCPPSLGDELLQLPLQPKTEIYYLGEQLTKDMSVLPDLVYSSAQREQQLISQVANWAGYMPIQSNKTEWWTPKQYASILVTDALTEPEQ